MVFTENNVPEMDGKVVVITGANSGLGFSSTEVLANRGATVVMACRNEQKALQAIANITENLSLTKEQAADQLLFRQVDMSDLGSIKSFAEQFLAEFDRCDVLMLNAGLFNEREYVTADGFESTIGVNHLGHFALTGHLIGVLNTTPDSRIVSVSSMLHNLSFGYDLDDLNFEERGYNMWYAYANSKLANIHFSLELARRLKAAGSHVKSVAAHPGLSATNMTDKVDGALHMLTKLTVMSSKSGAMCQIRAAVDAEVQSGDYIGPMFGLWGPPTHAYVSSTGRDTKLQSKLWRKSEEMTGVKYDLFGNRKSSKRRSAK